MSNNQEREATLWDVTARELEEQQAKEHQAMLHRIAENNRQLILHVHGLLSNQALILGNIP
jgi:hypothetical protein